MYKNCKGCHLSYLAQTYILKVINICVCLFTFYVTFLFPMFKDGILCRQPGSYCNGYTDGQWRLSTRKGENNVVDHCHSSFFPHSPTRSLKQDSEACGGS